MKKLLLIGLSFLLLIVGCDELLNTDTTSPTVVITYPANNSTLDSTITIRAEIADDSDIATVQFLIDGIKVHEETGTIAQYEYTWNVCTLGTGTHTVLVKAKDSEGNEGQSNLFSYTLNATYDCENVCGGVKVADNCGTCDADSTNDCTADCSGAYGGDKVADNCGTCDNDSINNCIPDLEGTWIGNEVNSHNVWTCIITGNEMDLSGENEWYKGTFSINTQTDPKQLDYLLTDCFINEGIGLTALAIYKIENNSMTFAGNEPGATSRPDSFVGGRIMVLEKQ